MADVTSQTGDADSGLSFGFLVSTNVHGDTHITVHQLIVL